MTMPHENSQIPQRRADTVPLSQAERRDVIERMNALQGRSHSFVAEIARQATDARGRLDDDVYGIVRVTLKALAENQGAPPPLVFAVTHYETGEIRQNGESRSSLTRPTGSHSEISAKHSRVSSGSVVLAL